MHVTFHTSWSQPSFTHILVTSFTHVFATPSFTHNVVTHHIPHTSLFYLAAKVAVGELSEAKAEIGTLKGNHNKTMADPAARLFKPLRI